MKPVILAFARHYLPGHSAGGPIRSIANMATRLSNDFDVRIVTLDRDQGDSRQYPRIQVDNWNLVGDSAVYYASRLRLSLRRIASLISDTPHDVLYLNSFFDPVFTLRPLLARRLGLIQKKPVIVAPRGELSEAARSLKRWKKTPYLVLARSLGLCRGVTWQASSELEAEDIKSILKFPAGTIETIVVAPDCPAQHNLDPSCRRVRAQGAPVRICFLSRISPMKNLDYAIRVLGQVRAMVHFSIYGITEKAYWRECQELIHALPGNVVVEYHGPLAHDSVVNTIAGYDLFFLPSRGENFGHAIHEALAAGVPVLVSDQTPWSDLEEQGAGWALSLKDPSAFVRVIEKVATWDAETADAASKGARALALQVATNQQTVEANRSLFYSAIVSAERRYGFRSER